MKRLLDRSSLHTVCESADCPNVGECFSRKTCTFMILGSTCTRDCRFCAVHHGPPPAVDEREPESVAMAARELGLKHIVATSVTRDDLPDGGAGQFAATVRAIRRLLPEAAVELLIPDFQGDPLSLRAVLDAQPQIIGHNIETVPRLYRQARPQAIYGRSLSVLRQISQGGVIAKSGIMLGLGEKQDEVAEVMADLYAAGCRILTLGQYLRPSPGHAPVAEYITPEIFRLLAQTAYRLGFWEVVAGPLVRSSYHAAGAFEACLFRMQASGLKEDRWKNRPRIGE